jgi:hypothetical protein
MSAFGERGGFENPQMGFGRRRKSGLEVPLRGRIYGENKLLVFAPPLWHDLLVIACILGGAADLLMAGTLIPGGLLVGFLLLMAGLWAGLSNERMVCDLRNRTFRRFEGMGPGKRSFRGSLNELEAMVLTFEPYGIGAGRYRLVLYWRGQRQPPLVAEMEQHPAFQNATQTNPAVQPMLYRGLKYAQALGIPYYDNSYMVGRSPVPIL